VNALLCMVHALLYLMMPYLTALVIPRHFTGDHPVARLTVIFLPD
jgi:hypothetical protein